MRKVQLLVSGLAVVVAVSALGVAAVAVAQSDQPPSAPVPDSARAGGGRALGGGTTETKFVAISPCRLVDTRNAGGAIGANTGRTFKVTGGGAAFAAQGGVAGGCGIPAGVDAVEATILVPGPSGDGFMRAHPSNVPEPSASVVYFNGGQNSANTAGLAVCSSGCPAAGELTLKVYSSSAHVAVVANGYYIKPIAAAVRNDGTLGRNSRAVSSQRLDKGFFEVVFDRDISTCSWQGSASTENSFDYPGMVMLEQRVGNDNAIFVLLQDKDGELTDIPFEVLVTC